MESTINILNDQLLGQKPLIEEHLQKGTHQLSSFSFPSIFLWKDYFDFSIQTIDGHLCLFAKHDLGTFLYLPPLGRQLSKNAVEKCFAAMELANKGSGVSRIENVEEQDLSFFPKDEYTIFKKCGEYIYDKKDLGFFEGNRFKSKRSSYNQFVKNNRYEYRPFEIKMREDCLSLFDRWAAKRASGNTDEIYRQMLLENRTVHELAMRYSQELGLVGRVVLVDGLIKGYTFGYPLNDDMFCVLFEITDLSVKGLSVFIFREFYNDPALESYQLINAMDDFGLENIRKTKLSFRPKKIIPAYVISKKNNLKPGPAPA